jgi:hydroxymethylbilane synthase
LIDFDDALPAAGQGALGIEILSARSDVAQLLAPLSDAATTLCTQAERAVSRALGGSCQMPLAAHAVMAADGGMLLRAHLSLPDGSKILKAQAQGLHPESLAGQVVNDLYMQGAQSILDALGILAPQ